MWKFRICGDFVLYVLLDSQVERLEFDHVSLGKRPPGVRIEKKAGIHDGMHWSLYHVG